MPYVVPREQKRPPPGERPAPLSEVAGPQAAVTVVYVAAGVPLLGAPSMASPSAEAIGESTLFFFGAENLPRVKELEAELATKERVLASVDERFVQSLDRSHRSSNVETVDVAWFVAKTTVMKREKRKKKKKKKSKRTRRTRFRSCSS